MSGSVTASESKFLTKEALLRCGAARCHFILGESEGGVVCIRKRFQQMIDNALELIEIPAADMTGEYLAGSFKDAPHAPAARAFLDFLVSEKGADDIRQIWILPRSSRA